MVKQCHICQQGDLTEHTEQMRHTDKQISEKLREASND